MAKLSSDLSNPLKGRRPTDKLGGRAKSPFLRSWATPSPAKPYGSRKGRRKRVT